MLSKTSEEVTQRFTVASLDAAQSFTAASLCQEEVSEQNEPVLLQMQHCPVLTSCGDTRSGLLFYDGGSTISLVREGFASQLGIQGRGCVLHVQPAGHDVESWITTAYFLRLVDTNGKEHKILAYSLEFITAEIRES